MQGARARGKRKERSTGRRVEQGKRREKLSWLSADDCQRVADDDDDGGEMLGTGGWTTETEGASEEGAAMTVGGSAAADGVISYRSSIVGQSSVVTRAFGQLIAVHLMTRRRTVQ